MKTPKQIKVEKRIYNLMLEIYFILQEYCPGDNYFTACIVNNMLQFHNSYWEDKVENEINYYKTLTSTEESE